MVKRWLLDEPGSHLTIFQISFITDWATVDGEGFHAHVLIYIFMYSCMSNNLVNQSTKAISTNELRRTGPVLAVMSSGPMDLFLVCKMDMPVLTTSNGFPWTL